MTSTVQDWIDRAEAHFATALRESAVEADQLPNPHAVLHHAHACVQGLLRARLTQAAIPFPETPFLVVLLYLCIDLEPGWETHREHIRSLTTFMLDAEDAGHGIPEERTHLALEACMAFRASALAALERA